MKRFTLVQFENMTKRTALLGRARSLAKPNHRQDKSQRYKTETRRGNKQTAADSTLQAQYPMTAVTKGQMPGWRPSTVCATDLRCVRVSVLLCVDSIFRKKTYTTEHNYSMFYRCCRITKPISRCGPPRAIASSFSKLLVHKHTHTQSVGLLWTIDQSYAETYT